MIHTKLLYQYFLYKIAGHRKFGKDATINFNLPVRILINASKTLVKGKKEKEVISDLLPCFAPPSGLEPETL